MSSGNRFSSQGSVQKLAPVVVTLGETNEKPLDAQAGLDEIRKPFR